VIRQSLAESVVLAIGGTLIGAVLALIGVRAFTSLVPVQLPPWVQVHLDDRAA
jgi:ABC-type antimicrobial peptide transport system permease subunit